MSAPVIRSRSRSPSLLPTYNARLMQVQKAAEQSRNPKENLEASVPGAENVILVTGGYGHIIKFWQAHNGKCVHTVEHPDSQVNSLKISPDGQLLAACGYQHIRMYDAKGINPTPVVNYEGVSKNVMDVGFQEESLWMYTAGEDGTVRIWDLRMRNLQCQKSYDAKDPVNSAMLHPNQQDIILGDQSGSVHVWNLSSGHSEKLLPEPGASIQCVAVDSLGTMMAAVTNKGNCHIWNINSTDASVIPEHRKSFQAHKKYALKCQFSPDCSLLATSSADQTAKIFRMSDMELISELYVERQKWVWDIAFSVDSQYLFTASSDSNARLWSVADKKIKRKYVGHQKPLSCLAFLDGTSS